MKPKFITKIINAEKRFHEHFQKRRIQIQYRVNDSHIYKFKAVSPPTEVSKASVDSVWKKFGGTSYKWAQYYWSINSIASPYYIPSGIWFAHLCRKLNSLDRFGWPEFQDKNYLDVVFQGILQPDVVVRNISGQYLDADFNSITEEQAIAISDQLDELIIKPSMASKGGRGVEFYSKSDLSPAALADAFKSRKTDFVVQKVLHQHHKMAELNPESINSIRVQTLLWKGEVIILSSLVRVGVKGCRIDNPHASDGVSVVLTPEGRMIQTAYDRRWHPKSVLPNGQSMEGFEVPYYDRIIEAVKRLQYRVPHHRLVGWDMSISEQGEPILIEANLDYPEVYFHQLGKGPIISDPVLFDEVMRFVFKQ